jgi:hypothetical protein
MSLKNFVPLIFNFILSPKLVLSKVRKQCTSAQTAPVRGGTTSLSDRCTRDICNYPHAAGGFTESDTTFYSSKSTEPAFRIHSLDLLMPVAALEDMAH